MKKNDEGFTLVELLIVIVILGILATVVVFAVRGITDQGQTSACEADEKALEVALEAYYAQEGKAAGDAVSEAGLVTAGFLREESTLYSLGSVGANGVRAVVVQSADCGTVPTP